MKKMINLLIMLMLIGSILPLAFADESGNSSNNVEIDMVTQQQTEIMNDGLGAEIRFLQLEKALLNNINTGEEIVLLLNESGVDTTELRVILEELELLILPEIQNADPYASDAVSTFIDLKHDTVNLTSEFRKTVRDLLNSTTLGQIQQRTKNMTCNHTQNLSQIIQNKIRQYNRNQFQTIYQLLGENGSNYLLRYQNGSMTQQQVKQNITLMINHTKEENQFNFLSSLIQQKIRDHIQSQNQVQNASEGFQQRLENRMKKRLQKLEDFAGSPLYQQLMNRIQDKFNNMDNIVDGGNEGNNGADNGDSGNGQDKPGYGNNDESGSPGKNGGIQ